MIKQRHSIALTLAVLSAAPVAAFAQAQNFQGLNVQAGIGFVEGKAKTSASDNGGVNDFSKSSESNFGGTVGLGYTLPLSRQYTLGVLAEYNPGDIKAGTANASQGVQISLQNKFSGQYSFSLVPGYVIDRDHLAYLKVGYTAAKEKSTPSGPDAGGAGTISATVNGYNLGVGLRATLDRKFYGFAEANYVSFSNKTSAIPNGGGANLTQGGSEYNVLVGIGYSF